MKVTAYQLGERFAGIKEIPGEMSNPHIMAMLRLDDGWPEGDEVPWCSAFVNYVAWMLRLPRSKSLRARSWLEVGIPVSLRSARVGFDVVVLRQPGSPHNPDVLDAPGHVGFFSSSNLSTVALLGGNQSDAVKVSEYPVDRVLGVRRLWQD